VATFFKHCIGFYFRVPAGVHGQARAPKPSAPKRAGPPPRSVLTNARLVTSRKFLSRTTGFSHSSLLDTFPWVKNVAFGRAKSSTYAPTGTCARLSVLRIAACGTAVPPYVARPIWARGYSFVSPFRLFSSCYYGAGLAPRRPVLLAI